jgi:RNA-directed DNA polymerase
VEVAPESVARFKAKVREKWRSCQSQTSNQLRDAWRRYVTGWWQYFRLAEDRPSIFRLEPWIRRHIRGCFWLRWHGVKGRVKALRRLGVPPRLLTTVHTRRGAWRMAAAQTMQAGLSNAVLRRHGFLMPSDLAAQ